MQRHDVNMGAGDLSDEDLRDILVRKTRKRRITTTVRMSKQRQNAYIFTAFSFISCLGVGGLIFSMSVMFEAR